MKILIPTDFSKCANNAILYGLEIASKLGATITLLHIHYPYKVYQAYWIEDYVKMREAELEKAITVFSKKNKFKKITIHKKVEVGFPVPLICEIAEYMKADLIIMGATGKSDLATQFLGSNSLGVITQCNIPILTVPKNSKFESMTTAVFPTDFNMEISGRSLAVLYSLLSAHSTSLTILHILSQANEQPSRLNEAKISKKMAGTRHHFRYLHDTNIAQAVSNFMESLNSNLLVSVSHHHSLLRSLFFESVSTALAFRTRIPMLVLHDAR
jgi:nucleotide-binding universal stress UspA family protein